MIRYMYFFSYILIKLLQNSTMYFFLKHKKIRLAQTFQLCIISNLEVEATVPLFIPTICLHELIDTIYVIEFTITIPIITGSQHVGE